MGLVSPLIAIVDIYILVGISLNQTAFLLSHRQGRWQFWENHIHFIIFCFVNILLYPLYIFILKINLNIQKVNTKRF